MLNAFKIAVNNAITSFNGEGLFTGFKKEEITLEKKYFYGFIFHKDTELYDDLISTYTPSELSRLGGSTGSFLRLGLGMFRKDLREENGCFSEYAIFGIELSAEEVNFSKTTGFKCFNVNPETIDLFNGVVDSFPPYLKYTLADKAEEGIKEAGVVSGNFKKID